MSAVFITEPIHADGVAVLRDAGLEIFEGWTLSGPARDAALAASGAILVRIAPIPAAMFAAAPGLRVVSKHGVGCDNIDVAAARAQGAEVAVAAEANAVSVAEHAMMMLLGLARNVRAMDAAVREDYARRTRFRTVDLAGRTLLIVGYGRIGRRVAPLAAAFGMKVLLRDIAFAPGARAVDGFAVAPTLEDGLARADAVTVHVPLNPTTRGLLGPAELARLRPGAFVVNCARGGIVDEAALAEAAASGHLGGVGSDVFTAEPIAPDNPLLAIENAILTPHTAAITEEGSRRMAVQAAENARDAIAGRLRPEAVFAG